MFLVNLLILFITWKLLYQFVGCQWSSTDGKCCEKFLWYLLGRLSTILLIGSFCDFFTGSSSLVCTIFRFIGNFCRIFIKKLFFSRTNTIFMLWEPCKSGSWLPHLAFLSTSPIAHHFPLSLLDYTSSTISTLEFAAPKHWNCVYKILSF